MTTDKQKIAIFGAGSVGSALGKGWAKAGHSLFFVVLGGSDKSEARLSALVEETGARSGTAAEAVAFADVVVLAVPWEATEAALLSAGDLSGKIVLDATNPLKPNLVGLIVPPAGSGGQQVAAWAPGARVVKIFNSTGANNMENPAYGEGATVMLYAGDDAAAKKVAHGLAADLGFDSVDAGPLATSALLESLALLWITLAYPQGLGREFAFRLMNR
ncbi:MAG TPA: NAD(P)-binding domain-containing protein [Thermoanaerobaculia bacterium]|jgi:predicted dinucleotide-binding enzyme|nr:NAD(P)-binding domain-containing protein [Thermoanaerobaculia bacterium]